MRWENRILASAHAKHGAVIRLGPKEVSVNAIKGGVREVYSGGYEKDTWYTFFGNYGKQNMFSTPQNKPHSTRKRMISNIYSKSTILASVPLLTQTASILHTRLLPHLHSISNPSNPSTGILDIFTLFSATTMDIVTAYIFGLRSSSDLIRHPEELDRFLYIYRCRHGFSFFPQEMPRFTGWVRKWLGIRLVPAFVDEANAEIEIWTMGMCKRAREVVVSKERGDEVDVADTPVVYAQLSSALEKESKNNGDSEDDLSLTIASELQDHLLAGFDTSGITLTYLVHELCLHPDIQTALRTELLTLSTPLLPSSAPALPDAKALDALPLLHAVVWETLRLHPAIPGPQPRVTPASGCRLGQEGREYWIPGGVRVSASAGILHQNENVFGRAKEWRPERWLLDAANEEKRKEMDRWFWAFGSGGRMCVGSHLAVYQMKYIIAGIYSSFETTIVDDTGIEQSDAYTAPPKNDKLMIKLTHVESVRT